jgi:Ran GTPase-activating protein (RanGAP) involved in mRNA processing and transport
VLTALQSLPALQKIRISAGNWNISFDHLPSLSRLEVLLRSHDCKVKELVLEHVDTDTVGLHSVFRELERNSTITNLAIRDSVLSREIVQQVKKVVLRQNTVLQSLDLASKDSSALGSAGLAENAPELYRNTSTKTLDLSSNGLDDIESANALHELLRRNKTVIRLRLAENAFGRNAAAVRNIFEGFRSNTALQQLDLRRCGLGDQGISILANALFLQKASILELKLDYNGITA